MKKESEVATFFVYYVLQIVIFLVGLILVIRGVFDVSYHFWIGLILIIISGYMRFKYKVRKGRHSKS